MTSPYLNKPESSWPKITEKLLTRHPLTSANILEVATQAWGALWETRVGADNTAIELKQLAVPATVVGYFFEVLFAKELERRFPTLWRGCRQGDEKDLVYIPDASLSVEIKTSGQAGLKVFGNRSYGQQVQDQLKAKKEKSGYYITVNFYKQSLNLIRFGWIDASDWKPQKSPTGQMAGLPDYVYHAKLIRIPGDYQLLAPVGLLKGVGQRMAGELEALGISTIGQLLKFDGALPKKVLRIRDLQKDSYRITTKPK